MVGQAGKTSLQRINVLETDVCDSGKSSLLLALLRLLDIGSGRIIIDGIDLSTIPRELIRSRMTAIPQDPFILNGSVRLNVNPMGTIADDLIIDALTKIRLWPIIQSRGGLDADMQLELQLSHGQRQLFCLARAILRKSKILILDEVGGKRIPSFETINLD